MITFSQAMAAHPNNLNDVVWGALSASCVQWLQDRGNTRPSVLK